VASLLLTVAGLAKATSLVFAPAFVIAALSEKGTAPFPRGSPSRPRSPSASRSRQRCIYR